LREPVLSSQGILKERLMQEAIQDLDALRAHIDDLLVRL
jgi:hypothetical protein